MQGPVFVCVSRCFHALRFAEILSRICDCGHLTTFGYSSRLVTLQGRNAMIRKNPFQLVGLATAAALFMTTAALAGPERVAYPDGYRSNFVRYTAIDRDDRKIVRFMYVTRDALVAAAHDQAMPDGTVIVMEDHKAVLDAAGVPLRDTAGRFVPEDAVTNIFVMEKGKGWGADYPEDVRNSDWDYAWFIGDGSRKPDAKFDGCFSCHKAQAAADYTFSTAPFLGSLK
jgi:hypothetical protein